MTRLVAALFAVFAVALFVVPAEHAAAQSPRDCAAENRVADPGNDNAQCGACTTGRWWNGTACVNTLFNPSTFAADCIAAGTSYRNPPVLKQNVGSGSAVQVGQICWRVGGMVGNPQCYLVTHPDFNPDQSADNGEDDITVSALDNWKNCAAHFPPCVAPEVQTIPGNQLGGCSLPPRAVTVSASANGKVSAAWPGLATAIAEGESGEAPVNVTLTISADPDSGYYVTVWTGACESTNAGSGGADISQTCEVEPGTSDVTVGAVFAEAICPAGQDATAMGTCIYSGANVVTLKIANNCESAGWTITIDDANSRQSCNIPYIDDQGGDSESCLIGIAGGWCSEYFSDNDGDGATDFPARVSDGSGGNRRFVTHCQSHPKRGGGVNSNTFPHPQNDKGQTQCCGAGLFDADQDPSTACTAPIDDIAIGGAIIPETGDIVPTAGICTGLDGKTGTNSNGDATCYGHIVPGRDTAETGCVISASGSCQADFEKIRECHLAEKLTKFENGVALCGGSANCAATENLIVDECVCPASRAGVGPGDCREPTFRNCALAGKVHTVAGDGCVEPSTNTCPDVGMVVRGGRCFPYCPPGTQFNGTTCGACQAHLYNPAPGGAGAGSCFRCGGNGDRADAATCDCNPGFAKNESGFCVLASPRLELEGVLLSDVTVVAEGRYFVSEWVGAECAGDDAGDAGGTAVCSLGTGVGAGGVAGTVAAVFAYARAVSLGFSPTAGGTLRATMAVGGGQGLEAGEWVGVESGGRASSVEFLFFEAVPAEGYRVTGWTGCDGGAVSGNAADVGAKVCVVGPGEEDLEVRVVFEAVP